MTDIGDLAFQMTCKEILDDLDHPVRVKYVRPMSSHSMASLSLSAREWSLRDATDFHENGLTRERCITCANEGFEFDIYAASRARSHPLGLDSFPDYKPEEGDYGTLGQVKGDERLFAVVGIPDDNFDRLFEELWRGGVTCF